MEQRSLPRWIWAGLGGAITLVLVAAVGLLGLQAGWFGRGDGLPDLAKMPAFQLIDQAGQGLTAADVQGKVLLVGFIYTTCEDICPVVTAQMKGLQDDLAQAGLLGEAQLLSISVDPEQDRPERLAAYAAKFGADLATWRFLTGEVAHVREVVVDGFLLGVQRVSASGHDAHGSHDPGDYRVEHSGRIALVDRAGVIRAYYDGLAPDPQQVLADVRTLVGRR